MYVNSINFYNNYNAGTNNKRQTNKHIKFGTANNSNTKLNSRNEENKEKRKRNWIIAGTLTAVVTTAIGFLYFNGKKVKKTVTPEVIKKNLPKITAKSLETYQTDLDSKVISHKELAKNIGELNNMLKQEPEEEITKQIIEYLSLHFIKITQCITISIQDRIQYLNDYLNFLKTYFSKTEDFQDIYNTIEANKTLLEAKSKISKDIESNNESLEKILQSNATSEYKKEFIDTIIDFTDNDKTDKILETILKSNILVNDKKEVIEKIINKIDKNKTDKILETITKNTSVDKTEISKLESEINNCLIIHKKDPSYIMSYLYDRLLTITSETNINIDNALLMYGILTPNKIKSIVSKLIQDGSLNNYTLNENILSYEQNGKKHIFNFTEKSYKIVNSEQKTVEKKIINEFSIEEQEEFKNFLDTSTSIENKQKKIVSLLSKYQKDTSNIEKILNILNNNTDKQKIEAKKSEALKYFKNKIALNRTPETIIESLQDTINKFYPNNNNNKSLLQKCLVGNIIEHSQECNDFDDNMVGLVYGLGVCRHMAKLVNYLIKNSKLENIQACAVDNGGHAWNYLRFKNNDNSYTYYTVDTYFKNFKKTDENTIKNNKARQLSQGVGIKYTSNDIILDGIFSEPWQNGF